MNMETKANENQASQELVQRMSKQYDKGKPIFGLEKIPDDVLLRFARTQIGQQESYIAELEDALAKMKKQMNQLFAENQMLIAQDPEMCAINKDIAQQVKRESMYVNMVEMNKNLRNEVRKLKIDKDILFCRYCTLQKSIQVG